MTKQANNQPELVCPECLVNHCKHCKCERCENKTGDWIKRFDKTFRVGVNKTNWIIDYPDILANSIDLKLFITDVLEKQKQKYIQMGNDMKVEKASILNGKLRTDQNKDSTLSNEYSTKLAYNQAIQDFMERIKSQKIEK